MVEIGKALDKYADTPTAGLGLALLIGLLTLSGRTGPLVNLAVPIFAGVGALFKWIRKWLEAEPYSIDVMGRIGRVGGVAGFYLLAFFPYAFSASAVLGVGLDDAARVVVAYTTAFLIFSASAVVYIVMSRSDPVQDLPFKIRGPMILVAVAAVPFILVVIVQEVIHVAAPEWVGGSPNKTSSNSVGGG